MNNDSSVHYVKFMRGSKAAWEALQATPDRISNDTLYFIYQNAETSIDGKLYLGQKLISGTGDGLSGDININDIGDVYIDNETLSDKQILVYNQTTQHWDNTSLSTIIDDAVAVMRGATAAAAGISGLVPMPQAGDQNKFLKGDGTWASINIPVFQTEVFTLSNNQVKLNGFDFASVGSVPIKTNNGLEWTSLSTGKLNRSITTLEKLQAQLAGTDPDPIDTNMIYMVLNGNDPSTENAYDEYMVINNRLERLGTFGQVNLNNYVTVSTFNTAVGQLNDILNDTIDSNSGKTIPGLVSRVSYIENNYVTKDAIGDLDTLILSPGNETLVQEINTLNNRMKWQELENN